MSSHVLRTLVLCSTVAYQLYRVKLDCNIVWMGVSGPSHSITLLTFLRCTTLLYIATLDLNP